MANDWLDSEQVLERLGIRPQTLYAYVSRGRIEAAAHPQDPRRSLYRASDVAALAQRKARGRRAADVEPPTAPTARRRRLVAPATSTNPASSRRWPHRAWPLPRTGRRPRPQIGRYL